MDKYCSLECMNEWGGYKWIQRSWTVGRMQIKPVSKTSKNTSAKFSQKTKEKILERDKVCIISWNPIEEYHHSFFWAHQANYWKDRNEHYEWVWLSGEVHYNIHHWVDAIKAKVDRAKCVEYSTKMRLKYKNKNPEA